MSPVKAPREYRDIMEDRLVRRLSKPRQRELRLYNLAKAEAWARAEGLCEGCGAPGEECHHLYGRATQEDRISIQMLAILCHSCHEKVTGTIGGMDLELRDRLRKAHGPRSSEAP